MIFNVLLLVTLVRYAVCGNAPLLQWDPDTVEDCVGWYDNDGTDTCEHVRKIHGVTPEEFHAWNPSVGLDCNWQYWQSYCIITQEKIDALPKTTSTIIAPTTTSATASLAPSPTAWDELGCYAENVKVPVLEQNMNPNGDASLTIPKCKNSCYRRSYQFAGVQQGNQCWCSSYVGGEKARNQTDCNMECTGDKASFCGGKGFLNVFMAQSNSVTSKKTIQSAEGVKSSTSPTTTAVTGAAARIAVLG
ncbi:WSC domain protein [Paraphaeosphaeria sporulosa]